MSTNKIRRKLIQATLVAPLAANAAGTSGRLHGAPASINQASGDSIDADRFILPLAHAGIPSEALTDLSKVSALVESVLTDENSATDFFINPRIFFERNGLDGSDATLVDPVITLLVALSDLSVKEALKNRDYTLTFDYMRAAGVFEPQNHSALQRNVQKIMEESINEMRGAIRQKKKPPFSQGHYDSYFIDILKMTGVTASEEDLAAVAYLLDKGGTGVSNKINSFDKARPPVALVLVLVVAVAVVIAAVVTEVKVKSTNPIIKNEKMDTSIFNGDLLKLDPAAMRNMRRAYRIAEITGDGQFALYARREAIKEEVTVVMESLLNLNLIRVSKQDMPTVIEAVYRYACKSEGVSNHAY